jgi:hypothetical protein
MKTWVFSKFLADSLPPKKKTRIREIMKTILSSYKAITYKLLPNL